MSPSFAPSFWDQWGPYLLSGGAVLVCVAVAVFLSNRLREMGEDERPGRVGCPRCGYDVHMTPTRCPECGLEWPVPKEVLMPIYSIPEDSGPFVTVRGNDGQFAVAEEAAAGGGKNAAKLGLVFIPCRDEPQAETDPRQAQRRRPRRHGAGQPTGDAGGGRTVSALADAVWVLLYLLGSATSLLLLVAVVKWLTSKPEGWGDDEEDVDEGVPLDAEPAEETPWRVGNVVDYQSPASREAQWDEFAGDADHPPGVRELEPGEKTRRLLATSDVFHADLLSATLREAGVWSFVHGNADAFGAAGVPATSIYVGERDFERAERVVRRAEAAATASRAARAGEGPFCPRCGYDLRGTPQRCPECGAATLSDEPRHDVP